MLHAKSGSGSEEADGADIVGALDVLTIAELVALDASLAVFASPAQPPRLSAKAMPHTTRIPMKLEDIPTASGVSEVRNKPRRQTGDPSP